MMHTCIMTSTIPFTGPLYGPDIPYIGPFPHIYRQGRWVARVSNRLILTAVQCREYAINCDTLANYAIGCSSTLTLQRRDALLDAARRLDALNSEMRALATDREQHATIISEPHQMATAISDVPEYVHPRRSKGKPREPVAAVGWDPEGWWY